PGADHLPFVGDQDAILDEMEEFLTGVRHRPQPDMVLATVLVLRVAHERRLHAHIVKQIEGFRGREIQTSGERTLALFDGPARAIRCALAVTEYARRLDIRIRAGLHTGECEVGAPLLESSATAPRVCVQVADAAAPEEVLVSSTVKDLVAGSGIRFEDRGVHTFEGIGGEWRLFAAERVAL
ncbi:MAG TPA: adenylate/guanylate cyclase domain-containing protein, partial [Thermoanaerobaculia bacterium]